jgi:hypothetical protein
MAVLAEIADESAEARERLIAWVDRADGDGA